MQPSVTMEINRTISKVIYRIEPKPDGGFIARSSDPAMPPLEASTREELQRKVLAAINATLGAEFPGLNRPVQNKQLKFAFHIEAKPGGGFIAQSPDPSQPPIEGATREEVEQHLAARLAGALGNDLLPELSQALGKPSDSGDVKVFVNRKVGFSASLGSHKLTLGNVPGFPPVSTIHPQDVKDENDAGLNSNSPIVPAAGGNWKLFCFLLGLTALAVLIYFFLHR